MRSQLAFAAAAAGLLLASCAHMRPEPSPGCALRALPLKVGQLHPQLQGLAKRTTQGLTFEDELAQVLAGNAPGITAAMAAQPAEFLVLSGGSQNGAFGGGLALGLRDHPEYRVVTGISTGALLSTLIFLANSEVAKDRIYPQDLGDGRFKTGVSNLQDLAAALSISREASLLRTGRSQLYDGLVRGSVGELSPLRERMLGFISKATLLQLGAAHAAGRRLYVGVVSVDDGRAYAIDMTELASRLRESDSDQRARALSECYADALLASSSVPVAAQPVTLEIVQAGTDILQRDLFVDGGVRYGVFLRQVQELPNPKPVNVTLIVNGKLYSRPWEDDDGVRPQRWSSITLAVRSVDLLVNQVQRFSVEDVESFPRAGGALRMAFISNENLTKLPEDPGQHYYDKLSCDAWRERDEAEDSPVEFHPRYMACLLDYGLERGQSDPWNVYVVAVPPPP